MLLSSEIPKNDMKMHNIMKNLTESAFNSQIISPSYVQKEIAKTSSNYQLYRQADSFQAFNAIINLLDEECIKKGGDKNPIREIFFYSHVTNCIIIVLSRI